MYVVVLRNIMRKVLQNSNSIKIKITNLMYTLNSNLQTSISPIVQTTPTIVKYELQGEVQLPVSLSCPIEATICIAQALCECLLMLGALALACVVSQASALGGNAIAALFNYSEQHFFPQTMQGSTIGSSGTMMLTFRPLPMTPEPLRSPLA